MSEVDHNAIVLRTHSSTPEFNGGCDCAVLNVTAKLIEAVRRRLAVADSAYRSDPTLWEMSFGSADPQFHGSALLEACEDADAAFAAEFERAGKAQLPDHAETGNFEAVWTECDEMVLRVVSGSNQDIKAEMAWRAMPKNAETIIMTEAMTIDEIERCLGATGHPR